MVFKQENTYDDFHSNEVARCGLSPVPMQNTLVVHSHTWVDLLHSFLLVLSQRPTDLYDIISCPFVNLRVLVPEVVQDIHGKSAITRTNLVYDQVLVREIFEQVFRDEGAGYSMAVVRLHPSVLWHGQVHEIKCTCNSSVGVCQICLPGPSLSSNP
jgi:hypothetical protein